jgi:CRISPR-associated protein Cas1
MRTLYVVDHSARVRIRKGNVVVERSAHGTRVPIETLDAVVLLGRAEVTNDALGELVKRGIRVSAVSKGGRLRFALGGPVSGNVLLRVAQHEAVGDLEHRLQLCREIVAGKLQNCRRMMLRWAWDAKDQATRSTIRANIEVVEARLGSLGSATDGDTIRGLEGDATRRYFKALASHLGSSGAALTFQRRTRRPPRDAVNALLSFVYGLVLAEVVGALDAVGLDPQVGYLHHLRPGRPSLALDLVEELRPSVADRFAVSLITRNRIGPGDFERQAGDAVYLGDAGRRRLLRYYDEYRSLEVTHPLLDRQILSAQIPGVQATLLARHLRGDLSSYPPYVLAS